MAEKHHYAPVVHVAVLDAEKMGIAHREPLVDGWEPEDEYPRPSLSTQSFQHVLIFALFCSNIFFAALAVFFYNNAHCPVYPHRIDPFSISAASRDARAHISYEQRTFTGALTFNSSTHDLSRSPAANSTEPQYVGDPRTTPGLDRAWKNLLDGSRFPLSDEEITPYLQKNLSATTAAKKPTTVGTVYAELDVFHSLSCLNSIRLALDDDFYSEHGPQDGLGWQKTTRLDREKLDYCIDHLRQSLQCSADLSVVPLPPRSSSGGINFAEQPRTCRKWDDVRSWLDRRQERSRFMSTSIHHEQRQQYSGV
ncbi:putative tat pathway signal sequence protein [Neofusicoccum parvum UCRNP2]|uniref:Putative tat pathway signal sequence protein n=1 Tax=Botryosphaeria parva (strain UCR-NP2) TaxID=1287680 RepID=R1FWM9_BOTPV|nr:putative tat pathway signal sequence protein [Neofusicoccum parvum UCRNP2]